VKVCLPTLRGVEVFQRILQTRKNRKEGIEREYEGIVDLRPSHQHILHRLPRHGVDRGQRHQLRRGEGHDNDGQGLCPVDQKVKRVVMGGTVRKNVFVDLHLLKILLNEGRHLLFHADPHPFPDEGHHHLYDDQHNHDGINVVLHLLENEV